MMRSWGKYFSCKRMGNPLARKECESAMVHRERWAKYFDHWKRTGKQWHELSADERQAIESQSYVDVLDRFVEDDRKRERLEAEKTRWRRKY